MKRIASLFALLATSTSLLMAQSGNLEVKGTVFDFGSAVPLYPANIQVFSLPDSTYVNGSSTDEDGAFLITGLKAGNFVAKATFMGYINTEKSFTLRANSRTTDLGKITMKGDAKILSEVVVSGTLAKVQMINDTVVFNGEAFKLPEGSSLEDLVRKLPGVQIGSDGQIKVNGKTVSKILVNGQEFFDNDQSVALQNLTADMVEKIKSYEKQSDFARQTGIDDGEEQTVLDLTVKKGMAQGWFGNASVGYGQPMEETVFDVKDLYNVSLTLNRFAEDRQFTVIASAGQTAGGAGGGGRGMGGMGGGLSKNYQAGINFARNLGREVSSDSYQYEIGGSVNFSSSDSKSQSKSSSENFVSKTFDNKESSSKNKNYSLSGQLRFEWNYDEKTSLIFTPSVSYSTSDSKSESISKTFTRNPYLFATNPLDSLTAFPNPLDPTDLLASQDSLREYLSGRTNNRSISDSENKSMNGNIQFVKRLGTQGRNISFRGTYQITRNTSNSYTHDISYIQKMKTPRDTYSKTPNDVDNWSAQLSYNEPVGANTFLQFSYNFSYRNSNSDRATYEFTNNDLYSKWGDPDWILYDGWDTLKSERLSQLSTYKNLDHTIQLQIRKVSDKYNLSAGISVLPQYSSMNYSYQNIKDTVLSRTVFNWTPTVNLRYRWTRQEQINFQYRGSSSQPSMTDLLAIHDDSNPRAIRDGNPDLKPTFSNNFSINYSKSNPVSLCSFNARASFSNTLRNITSLTTYANEGSVTTTKPVNMSGAFSNWSSSANINYNFSFTDQRYSINNSTGVNYNHVDGWASSTSLENEAKLRTTLTTSISEGLSATYRDDWVTIDLDGNLSYRHSTNNIDPSRNMDTYDFRYGPSITGILPWRNIRLASDLQMSSRRGYSSSEMNTDELLWNASASISFLQGNKGTISIAVYDILQQRSNVSRQMSAISRSDSYNNTINSYLMATFIYRLQMFGDKNTRQSMRGRGGFSGSMGGFGGGMGGFGGGMGG